MVGLRLPTVGQVFGQKDVYFAVHRKASYVG